MDEPNKNIQESDDQAGKTDLFQELTERLEKREKEKEDYLNGWKRAKADLINYQKDEVKRFEEILKFGNMELIQSFIPVLDSFDLALSVLEKEGKAERGVYMIITQLEDVLKKSGLERMVIKNGEKFDANVHESIGELESDEPPGTIAEEIVRGYLLNGRVIRPARVKLSKSKM